MRNPYKRGTAGPPFGGILPMGTALRARKGTTRKKRTMGIHGSFLAVALRNPAAERGEWPKPRVGRVANAALDRRRSLCYNGGVVGADDLATRHPQPRRDTGARP